MKNLIEILQDEKSSIKLEVSGEDLLEFSNELINRAKTELVEEFAEARKEKYLTKGEVKRMCDVCDELKNICQIEHSRHRVSEDF